ncbi:MAG: DUF445 domain-containing protein [Selenomonadaceae bacterium]|nr:DUF445 domain-containing protein [Selenomonadaceae bacterium]
MADEKAEGRGAMPWSHWNKADKTLLFAFVVFVFSICVHLAYRGNVFAEGFLFCAEAALVGGIADWFAVTALFRKPLGFPYHTAILPRRRASFIQASVTMVQKEFFSRRKIFHHLEQLHLMPMLLDWLGKPETEAQLTQRAQHYIRDFLLRQKPEGQAAALAEKFRQTIGQVEPEDVFAACGRWLQKSGKDKAFLFRLSVYFTRIVEKEETRAQIERLLERYKEERVKTGWDRVLASLAEAVDAVNLDDAAGLIQKQVLSMLRDLGTEDSPLQKQILGLIYEKAAALNEEPAFHQFAHELKDALLSELPLEDVILRMLGAVRQHFSEDMARAVDPAEEDLPALHSQLLEILRAEYEQGLRLMQEDTELRLAVGHLLYDLIARSALHAQTLVGVIVKDVLSRLTDEQLNHLVYDKVEPDLLWIRMNGSIVGSGIGLLLFILLKLAGYGYV